MSIPSNLYAEKIFSEHPLVLWALDDKLDYVSLISESQRNIFSLWSETGSTLASGTALTGEPFVNSYNTKVSCDVPVGATNEAILISPNIINFQNLNQSLGTFCVGTHFYSNSAYLESVSIGYEYTDPATSQIIQEFKTFQTSIFEGWGFISETFQIPNKNTTMRIVIKVTTVAGGATIQDYEFYFNGITLGQWSEEFNVSSLGIETQNFPTDINLTTTSDVVPAAAYGISSDTAYYLVNENSLVAKNTGIPLVFGSSGVTKIIPNNGNPSLIIPGKGFLHEEGRHNSYTVEFWTRINSESQVPKKIFGPIASGDGLYVDSGFLTLVIDGNFKSHFVGEWFRPMLLHITLTKDNSTVMINGEEVISLDFLTDSINLSDGLEDNWLGFYSHQDVNPIEIDCVAIYSYKIPNIVAKRRWAYGQAVGSSESIDSAYSGVSAVIDYTFADYTTNYTYPGFAQWQQGSFDNLSTTATALTTPAYDLPIIFTGTKTLQDLYNDSTTLYDNLTSGNLETENYFISLNPNNTWDNEGSYINFSNFNMLNDQVASIYGVFQINNQSSGTDDEEQILFKIYNQSTGNYFNIKIDGLEIVYSLTYNGVTEELHRTDNVGLQELFAAGINIQDLVDNNGGNVSTFFGNQNSLSLYVGGDAEGDQTFKGYIFSVGFSTALNLNSISQHFEANGIAVVDTYIGSGVESSENALALLEHTASYTLLPTFAYDKLFLDIGVSGHWEDYLPLSYFAQYVKNDTGNSFYDLDFLQFNLGYPSPSSLDYNTENASVRSYLTFQYITNGANSLPSTFTTTVSPNENSVIDVSDYPLWSTTKFEVVDNTLIYPRKDIDFNQLAIVYSLDFNIRGILTKPVSIKKLEIASQAFNDNSFNPIGTRFGTDLFPYKRSGIYYDYKSKNPFSIYKGSTPYLYMNRTSGIQVRGDFDSNFDRGISMPINQSVAENYRISAFHSWIRYDQDVFPATPISLFEIKHKANTIIFYIVANDDTGQRGKIYAKNKSDNSDFNGISYFINGNIVRDPILTIKEWVVLGINFAIALNLDLFLGSINLNSPAIFNNIAYYQANNLQQLQSKISRPWAKVKQDGATEPEWSYWLNNYTWDGVLFLSTSDLYGVNSQDVYNNYMGTNKIIIDDEEGMIFDADKMRVYNDTTWSISIGAPV